MEVDLDKVAENTRLLKKACGKRVIAVLKADGYGCGDCQVARAVIEGGADMLAVSSLDEAMMLRNEGFATEILILGATDKENVGVMIENNITAAAYSMDWVQALKDVDCQGLKVHLKVDTGMNRIGFREESEMAKARDILLQLGCRLEGIFTHFSCADFDLGFTKMQYDRFKHAVEALGGGFEWIHCDNSDAAVGFIDDYTNACRIGISLYGVSTYYKGLHYPISLHTRVVMVKHVHKGDKIGYGATYEASGDEIIATLPIGYADGFIRKNQGRRVYVDGQYGIVVGRVCMDQAMVRLEKEVEPGTLVEIFGAHIHLEDMAQELDTIPYEVICLISGRVTRNYTWHGEQEKENARMIKSEALNTTD